MTVRRINTAQANAPKPYRPLAALNIPVAPGWEARLATDGNTCAFSVKDTTDPCGFTLFSDDIGVIYTGEALRRRLPQSTIAERFYCGETGRTLAEGTLAPSCHAQYAFPPSNLCSQVAPTCARMGTDEEA